MQLIYSSWSAGAVSYQNLVTYSIAHEAVDMQTDNTAPNSKGKNISMA